MSTLERMASILRAQVNDLLVRAEQPEAALKQILRDMEVTLQQADVELAEQQAQLELLRSDLSVAQQQANVWREKTDIAGSHIRDSLMLEALGRLRDAQKKVELFATLADGQAHAVHVLRSNRDMLRQKYENTWHNREALIACARFARAPVRLAQAMATISPSEYN